MKHVRVLKSRSAYYYPADIGNRGVSANIRCRYRHLAHLSLMGFSRLRSFCSFCPALEQKEKMCRNRLSSTRIATTASLLRVSTTLLEAVALASTHSRLTTTASLSLVGLALLEAVTLARAQPRLCQHFCLTRGEIVPSAYAPCSAHASCSVHSKRSTLDSLYATGLIDLRAAAEVLYVSIVTNAFPIVCQGISSVLDAVPASRGALTALDVVRCILNLLAILIQWRLSQRST